MPRTIATIPQWEQLDRIAQTPLAEIPPEDAADITDPLIEREAAEVVPVARFGSAI